MTCFILLTLLLRDLLGAVMCPGDHADAAQHEGEADEMNPLKGFPEPDVRYQQSAGGHGPHEPRGGACLNALQAEKPQHGADAERPHTPPQQRGPVTPARFREVEAERLVPGGDGEEDRRDPARQRHKKDGTDVRAFADTFFANSEYAVALHTAANTSRLPSHNSHPCACIDLPEMLMIITPATDSITATIFRHPRRSPRNHAAPRATAAGLRLMTIAPTTPLTICMPMSRKMLKATSPTAPMPRM